MMRERRSAHNSGDKYLLVCSCHLGGRLCRSAVKEIAHRPPYGTRQLIDLLERRESFCNQRHRDSCPTL